MCSGANRAADSTGAATHPRALIHVGSNLKRSSRFIASSSRCLYRRHSAASVIRFIGYISMLSSLIRNCVRRASSRSAATVHNEDERCRTGSHERGRYALTVLSSFISPICDDELEDLAHAFEIASTYVCQVVCRCDE